MVATKRLVDRFVADRVRDDARGRAVGGSTRRFPTSDAQESAVTG